MGCLRGLDIIHHRGGGDGDVAMDAVEGWVAMSVASFDVVWGCCLGRGVVGLSGGTIGVECLHCLGIVQCSGGVGSDVAMDAVEGWVAMSVASFDVAWRCCLGCGVVRLSGGMIGMGCLHCLGIVRRSEGVGGDVAVDAVEEWVAMSAASFKVA